jgi:hypothetical protein
VSLSYQPLIEKFRACVPEFADLPPSDQECLAKMFWLCIARNVEDTDVGARISGKTIQAIWGRPQRMKEVVQYKFFGVDVGSNLDHLTSRYTPCPEMLKAFECMLREGSGSSTAPEHRNKSRPRHAQVVESKTATGSRRHGKGNPASFLPIHTAQLRLWATGVCKVCRIAASKLLYLESVSPQTGCIPMRYREIGAGRIFDEHTLQAVPRSARSVALSGLNDYDISNCHLAVMRQLALRLGVQMPTLDNYLANKADTRKSIAQNIYKSIDRGIVSHSSQVKSVKAAILLLAYGGKLSTSPKVELSKLIDQDSARLAFVRHPLVRSLNSELDLAAKAIVAAHATSSGVITNAFGVRSQFSLPKDYKSAISHIITGVEAKALDAILQRWGDSVLLAIHDGWVMRESIPVEQFEDEIAQACGLSLRVEVERIEAVQGCGEEGCAPNSKLFKSFIDQDVTPHFGVKKKTNAPRGVGCPGGGGGGCAVPGAVPDWVGAALSGGLVVSSRPRWNLPPGYRGVYARVGRPRSKG